VPPQAVRERAASASAARVRVGAVFFMFITRSGCCCLPAR
jgi:hypothetical protein